jgi:hypothetical protein
MLQRCQLHDQPYRLDLDDPVQRQPQELQRSRLGVVRQNLFPRHPDARRLDEELLCHLGVGLLGDLVQRLRHLDEALLGAQCGPCPGSVRMGCCLDEPSDGEYPCPGSKRKDCFPDEEFQAVEPEPQLRQVPPALGPLNGGLLLGRQGLLEPELLALQRKELVSQLQALWPPSSGPFQPLGKLPLAWLLLEEQWWKSHP